MPRKSKAKKAAAAAAAAAGAEPAGTAATASTGASSAKKRSATAVKEEEEEDEGDDEDESTTTANKRQAMEGSPLSVYVSGISYTATEEDLRDFFAPVGTVTGINMPRYHDSGKPRGYAHVDFSTPEEAQKALKLNGEELKNRYLDIALSRGAKVSTPMKSQTIKGDAKSTTLFVGNMPYDAADDDILKLFKPCGEIAQVRAGIDAGTQRTKGFAYIEFATQEAADKAMAMINPMLKGRTLRLDYDIGRKKGSYKGRMPLGK